MRTASGSLVDFGRPSARPAVPPGPRGCTSRARCEASSGSYDQYPGRPPAKGAQHPFPELPDAYAEAYAGSVALATSRCIAATLIATRPATTSPMITIAVGTPI